MVRGFFISSLPSGSANCFLEAIADTESEAGPVESGATTDTDEVESRTPVKGKVHRSAGESILHTGLTDDTTKESNSAVGTGQAEVDTRTRVEIHIAAGGQDEIKNTGCRENIAPYTEISLNEVGTHRVLIGSFNVERTRPTTTDTNGTGLCGNDGRKSEDRHENNK